MTEILNTVFCNRFFWSLFNVCIFYLFLNKIRILLPTLYKKAFEIQEITKLATGNLSSCNNGHVSSLQLE